MLSLRAFISKTETRIIIEFWCLSYLPLHFSNSIESHPKAQFPSSFRTHASRLPNLIWEHNTIYLEIHSLEWMELEMDSFLVFETLELIIENITRKH